MATECELLSTCGFFKKYQSSQELACRGFIQQYCQGPKMNDCARKKYRAAHGTPPPDNMMPSGQIIG